VRFGFFFTKNALYKFTVIIIIIIIINDPEYAYVTRILLCESTWEEQWSVEWK